MPLNTVGLNALKPEEISHGTAIMNSLRIIAGAMELLSVLQYYQL